MRFKSLRRSEPTQMSKSGKKHWGPKNSRMVWIRGTVRTGPGPTGPGPTTLAGGGPPAVQFPLQFAHMLLVGFRGNNGKYQVRKIGKGRHISQLAAQTQRLLLRKTSIGSMLVVQVWI